MENKYFGIDGLVLLNYLIIQGLKKYKGNGLMNMLSCEIFSPFIHFGQIVLNPTILIGSFWLVFFTMVFLLNHHDNNIIWLANNNFLI